MKIAAQDTQVKVTTEAALRAVAATRQAVAGLQGADCRLDPGMALASPTEFDACLLVLPGGLMRAEHGETGVGNDLAESLLVLGRMKAPVERRLPNAPGQAVLQSTRLLDDHVAVVGVAGHQIGVGDEAGPVLVEEQLTPELDRLGRLATLGELGVGLKDAEPFLPVWDLLALQHAATSGVADVPRSLEKHRQFVVQGLRFEGECPRVFRRDSQFVGAIQDGLGEIQELAVEGLQPLLIAGSFAGSDTSRRC